jgi:predicted ATPase
MKGEAGVAHPFLKSIKPVNLLSFGPNTEEIELRPLNILIGPNGSGKSNFIEVLRLLHSLPDKEPWSVVLATGGASEWVWKRTANGSAISSLRADFYLGDPTQGHSISNPRRFDLTIALEQYQSSFRVHAETIGTADDEGLRNGLFSWFERHGSQGGIHHRLRPSDAGPILFDVNLDRSLLSQLSSPQLQAYGLGEALPELFEIAEFLEGLEFHQDWEFGADLSVRDPIPVGQRVERLDEGGYNLAQMLAYFRDYDRAVFARVDELMKKFYEPFEGLEVRLIGTHLQVAVQEDGGFSTPAYRLSDGTLRWLALLAILLNPKPAPVTCIDEPELGLHPDMLPTLADLLVDASKRTQLIVTTHSTGLVDAFSDDPESVCVCEKVDGATQIRRLNADGLRSWLEDYSLGTLWAKGEIGGNRW